jgi:hypothetical protein
VVNLTELANRYRVIVDTSSLMYGSRAEECFIQLLLPKYKQFEKKLVIYSSVANEIDRNTEAYKPSYTRRVAQQAQQIVRNLTIEGTTELVMTKDNFTDFVIIGEMYRLRRYFDQGLITQDEALAYDALIIKKIRSSVYPTDIKIYRISHTGELMNWEETASASGGNKLDYGSMKYRVSPPKNIIVMPASRPSNGTDIGIHSSAQKKSHLKQDANEAANKNKPNAEAKAILQKRFVNTHVLGSKSSVIQQQPGNSNFLESFLRTVAGTFSHQKPSRIGGSR